VVTPAIVSRGTMAPIYFSTLEATLSTFLWITALFGRFSFFSRLISGIPASGANLIHSHFPNRSNPQLLQIPFFIETCATVRLVRLTWSATLDPSLQLLFVPTRIQHSGVCVLTCTHSCSLHRPGLSQFGDFRNLPANPARSGVSSSSLPAAAINRISTSMFTHCIHQTSSSSSVFSSVSGQALLPSPRPLGTFGAGSKYGKQDKGAHALGAGS